MNIANLWPNSFRANNAYFGTFATTSLIQVFGVASGILTARLLGPAGKGDVAALLWLPNLMIAAGLICLDQAVALEVSRRPGQARGLVAAGFWTALFLGFSQAFVLWPAIPLILGPDKAHLYPIARIMLVHLPITYGALTLLGVDQGLQKFRRFNLLRLVPSSVYLMILTGLALSGKASVLLFSISVIAAQFVALIARASVAGRQLAVHDLAAVAVTGRRLIKQGLAFSFPALAGILLMRADLAVLIRAVSAERVGFYSVALAIAMGQTGLTTSITQVNFPKIAALAPSEAIQALRIYIRRSWAPLIAMGLLVAAASPFLIRYLFGTAFMPALPSALILVMAIAVWGISQVIDNGLRAMKMIGPGAVAYSAGLLILAAGSALFVPSQYEIGMALAMLLAQIGACAILMMSFLRIRTRLAAKDDAPSSDELGQLKN